MQHSAPASFSIWNRFQMKHVLCVWSVEETSSYIFPHPASPTPPGIDYESDLYTLFNHLRSVQSILCYPILSYPLLLCHTLSYPPLPSHVMSCHCLIWFSFLIGFSLAVVSSNPFISHYKKLEEFTPTRW